MFLVRLGLPTENTPKMPRIQLLERYAFGLYVHLELLYRLKIALQVFLR